MQYEQETDDDGIVIEENKIRFFFGYPAIKLKYNDGTFVNFLLPTMSDDMITSDIVKARLTPESDSQAIMYNTSSEPWLEFGDGLKLTEREYLLGFDLGRYVPIPLNALKEAIGK